MPICCFLNILPAVLRKTWRMSGETTPEDINNQTWRDLDVAPLAEAAWLAARDERSARFHDLRRCPTAIAPYGPRDPDGQLTRWMCCRAGCLDLHHELLARMVQQLGKERRDATANGVIRNFPAYVRRVAATQLVEIRRAEQVARGFPAKPSREDGAVGRVIAALRSIDGIRGEWLVALFRIMRAYPFSTHHVPGRWPVEGLIEERSKLADEHRPSPMEVRRDILFVLRRAGEILGTTWVNDNLTTPLLSNGGTETLYDDHVLEPDDVASQVLGRKLLMAYQRLQEAGLPGDEALKTASLRVCGVALPRVTREIRGVLRELDQAS